MEKFYVLSRPYTVAGDQNTVAYRVQTLEFHGMLLHSDRTIQKCIVRVADGKRSFACFPTEDFAYLAINDYYVMHGEHTPYVRVGGVWRDAGILNTGQTTDFVEAESKEMEFD